MKKISEELEKTIFDYLDGKLDPGQKKTFEQLLEKNDLLRSRFEDLQMTDNALRKLTVVQPSKNFTFTVMGKLDQYPMGSGLPIKNGIMLLAGILLVMTIAIVLVSTGVFDQQTTLDLNNLQFAQRYIKQTLPSVSLNGKMIVNIIILLNLALAFIVLDRTILKPLFNKRMEAGH